MDNNEKIVDKKINLACLIFAAVLLVAAVFACATLFAPLDYAGGIPDTKFSSFEEIFEDPAVFVPYILPIIIEFIAGVFALVAIINLIILFVGFFGFIGSGNDSQRMAKKLAKHAKKAFGIMGLAITVQLLSAFDDGVISSLATALFVVTGVMVVATYALVRYYRWFVVEKVDINNWTLIAIRDVFYFVFPIFLFGFISHTCIGTIQDAIITLSRGVVDSMLSGIVGTVCIALAEFAILLSILGIIRATIKHIPFDSSRKSAGKMICGTYIGAVVAPIVIIFCAAVAVTMIPSGVFDADSFVDYLLENGKIIIQIVLAAIAAGVAAIVENDDDERTVKLAPAKETASSEETTETKTETETETETTETETDND